MAAASAPETWPWGTVMASAMGSAACGGPSDMIPRASALIDASCGDAVGSRSGGAEGGFAGFCRRFIIPNIKNPTMSPPTTTQSREPLTIRVADAKDGLVIARDAPVARQFHRERELVVLERIDGGHLVTSGSNYWTSYVQGASVGGL